ncbi:hypothetical protein D3C84_730550 [compost metagenome]
MAQVWVTGATFSALPFGLAAGAAWVVSRGRQSRRKATSASSASSGCSVSSQSCSIWGIASVRLMPPLTMASNVSAIWLPWSALRLLGLRNRCMICSGISAVLIQRLMVRRLTFSPRLCR